MARYGQSKVDDVGVLDMDFPISQDGAEIISEVCAEDPVAIKKWNLVQFSFVKKQSMRIKIEQKLDKSKHELAILETFREWISANGNAATMASCVEILRKYDLTKLVEELEKRRDEIRSACTPSKSSDNGNNSSNFGVPFGPSDIVHNFTGRKKELELLHDLITKESCANFEQCCYTLLSSVYELGGIGKTTLARKYILEYGVSYFNMNVYWIEAESQHTLRSSFLNLAQKLKIDQRENLEIDEVVEDVYLELANQKCLFVFDNVEEYHGSNGVSAFLPNGLKKKPYLLMTSRKSGFVENEKVFRLDVLNKLDALELIKKMLPEANQESCAQLCTRMRGFPLALQQSLTCIRNSAISCKAQSDAIMAYLQEYDKNALELHTTEIQLNDFYKQAAYLTWKVSMDKIKSQPHGYLAGLVLCFMAYLNPDNIQYDNLLKLVQHYGDIRSLPFCDNSKLFFSFKDIQSCKIKKADFLEAVKSLAQYSIITSFSEKGIIKIHRLVQDVVKQTMRMDGPKEDDIVKIINGKTTHRDLGEIDFSSQYVSHGNAILPNYQKCKECRKLDPAQIVSTDRKHINLIKEILNCGDQDANRLFKVIRVGGLYSEKDTVKTAKFIKCLNNEPNPIDLYIRTFEKLSHNYPSFKRIHEQNLGVGLQIRDLSILLYQIENPEEKLHLKLLFEYIVLLCRKCNPNHQRSAVITKLTTDDQNSNHQVQAAISTLTKFGFIETRPGSRGLFSSSEYNTLVHKGSLMLLEQLDEFSGVNYSYHRLIPAKQKFLMVLKLLGGMARISFSDYFNDIQNSTFDKSGMTVPTNVILDGMEELARACIICNLYSIDKYLNKYQNWLIEFTQPIGPTSTMEFKGAIQMSMELLKILAFMYCTHFSETFLLTLNLVGRDKLQIAIHLLEMFGFIVKNCSDACNNYSIGSNVQEAIRNEYIAERSRLIDFIITALTQIRTFKAQLLIKAMCNFCLNNVNNTMLSTFYDWNWCPQNPANLAILRSNHDRRFGINLLIAMEALWHAIEVAIHSRDEQLKTLSGLISDLKTIVRSSY